MWTRRDLLRAAGLGASAAWLGCGPRTTPSAARPTVAPEDLRAALRTAVELVGARLQAPVAYARVRRRVTATVDLLERAVEDDTTTLVVIAGRDHAGRWRERAIDRADRELILASARALVADAPPGPATPIAIGRPVDRSIAPAVDPAHLSVADWTARADDLAARADAGATSRIIYRAVHLRSDDERTWVVTSTDDRSERSVRTRIGATAIAWHGNAPVAGAAEAIGGFGPEPDRLSAAQLAAVNADALALTTPGSFAPLTEAEVVLAPAVVAAVFAGSRAGGDEVLTVTEVPDLTIDGVPGYANYGLGALGGDGGPRRGGRYGRLTRRPSNLVVAPGPSDDLLADVDEGYLIDGVAHVVRADGQTALRVGRVRRVARGRRTGHAWRDLELRVRGELGPAVSAVGATAIAIAPDDDDPPLAVLTPPVRARVTLTPARGPR